MAKYDEKEPCNSVKVHTLPIFVLTGYQNFHSGTHVGHTGSRYYMYLYL